LDVQVKLSALVKYSIPLLNRIAEACGAVLKIDFVTKETKKVKEM
jgi:hypothetical protein